MSFFDDDRPKPPKKPQRSAKSFISEAELVKRYIVLDGSRLSVENEHFVSLGGSHRYIMGTNESLAHAAQRIGWADFL